MATIFDLRHTQASDSIPTSRSVLTNFKNIGIAVGIPLLLRIEAYIFHVRMLIYVIPVDRRQLEFLSDINVCYH